MNVFEYTRSPREISKRPRRITHSGCPWRGGKWPIRPLEQPIGCCCAHDTTTAARSRRHWRHWRRLRPVLSVDARVTLLLLIRHNCGGHGRGRDCGGTCLSSVGTPDDLCTIGDLRVVVHAVDLWRSCEWGKHRRYCFCSCSYFCCRRCCHIWRGRVRCISWLFRVVLLLLVINLCFMRSLLLLLLQLLWRRPLRGVRVVCFCRHGLTVPLGMWWVLRGAGALIWTHVRDRGRRICVPSVIGDEGNRRWSTGVVVFPDTVEGIKWHRGLLVRGLLHLVLHRHGCGRRQVIVEMLHRYRGWNCPADGEGEVLAARRPSHVHFSFPTRLPWLGPHVRHDRRGRRRDC